MNRVSACACLVVVLVLAACGSSGDADAPWPTEAVTPGTSMTWLLVAAKEGEDIHAIAEGLGAEVLDPVAGTRYWRLSVPDGMGMMTMGRRLEKDPRVMRVEADLGMSSPEGDGSTLPAGGLLIASAIPLQPALLRIGLEAARSRALGTGVLVAVIDSGVVPHEFLDGRVQEDGWDFIDGDPVPQDEINGLDDDGDGLVDEGWGHGTFVASLILAMAPEARVLPFRVLDADSVGRASDVAEAIAMAADRGAHVINLSVRVPDTMRVLLDAIRSARERGVEVIASAGNSGLEDVREGETFSVTAVDENDLRAPFASYGVGVGLSAPGVELLGAFPSDTGTARWSGTSFGAALVTGGFALLRELEPGTPGLDLLARLQTASLRIDNLNPELAGSLGAGRLNVEVATSP